MIGSFCQQELAKESRLFDEAKRWEVYSTVLASKGITLCYSKKVATATYNLATREIILPVWDCMDETTTQALASHEIGHAKFSNYDLDNFKELLERYKDLFNVVEDARIERLMKKEFAGLNGIFRDGYSVLAKSGVFPLENVNEAPLVERLNIFAKFGFMVEVPFHNREESEFAYRLLNLSTKTDVIDLCEDVLDYLKRQEVEANLKENTDSNASDESSSSEEDENESSIQDEDSNEEEGNECESSSNGDGSSSLERQLTDERMHSFNQTLQKKFEEEKSSTNENVPVVLTSKEILDSSYIELNATGLSVWKSMYKRSPKNFRINRGIVEKAAQEAASLFSQKKSALENASKRRMHCGRIDPRKLAKHSVEDAIFKIREKVEQGKSHGIVLLLDLSVSMAANQDVQRCACLQAAILGRFCQLAGIPFSILLFGVGGMSNSWSNDGRYKRIVKVADSSFFDLDFFLALAELKEGRFLRVDDQDGNHHWLQHGGCTPMLEAMVAARNEVLKMRSIGVEKAAVLVATDGGYTSLIRLEDRNVEVTGMNRLLLDAKSYSVKDFKGMKPECVRGVRDWGFELFAGYLKKETGASIIFSYIGTNIEIQSCWDKWKRVSDLQKEGRFGTDSLSAYTSCEPYLFKRTFLFGHSLKKLENVVKSNEICWSEKVEGDDLFNQYLVMNASHVSYESTEKKAFEGLDENSIICKISTSNRTLSAYKAFARAFIGFFS